MTDPVSPAYKKVVLLTGCSSGIGLETTLLFLSHQYRVFGLDINQFDHGVLEKLEGGKYQENFHFHKANLMEAGFAEESVRACVEKWGPRIDVLVNNAGVIDNFASVETYTDDNYNRVMAINLTAPLQLMRATIQHMLPNNSGRIINLCSKASVSGASSGLAYTVSKHGLLGATKQTAWRFKDQGITCNAVLPGGVVTNISTSMGAQMDMDSYQTLSPVHALNKAIEPRDIAHAVLFLAGEGAASINGVALPVDRAWGTI